MELTKQHVEKLAELSRLSVTESETERYQKTLGDILVHVDRLQEYMEGKDVSVDRDVITNSAELRADKPALPKTGDEQIELLRSARKVQDNLVVVPGVFNRSNS